MIYGPDDKPIVPSHTEASFRALNSALVSWNKKRVLEMLKKRFRFAEWCGPTLYDARGNRIEARTGNGDNFGDSGAAKDR